MRPSRLTLLSITALLLAATSVNAQGLGDAAKKEQKRRAATPTKSKAYTQDDLKGSEPVANERGVPAATGGSTGSAVPSTPEPSVKSTDAATEKRAQDERSWRVRAAAARERVELARRKYEALAPMNVAPDRPGEYVDFEGMKAAAKAEYEVSQKALDDLLEEARRANVPPGGLR